MKLKQNIEAASRLAFSVILFLTRRDASLLAAGLSFFAIISLAPFIILAIGISALFFDAHSASQTLHESLSSEVNVEVADFVTTFTERPAVEGESFSLAAILGLLLLLWSATRLFMETRRALHSVWHIPPPQEVGIKGALSAYIRARSVAALGTLFFSVLILALLAVRFVLEAIPEDNFGISIWLHIWPFLEPFATIALGTLLVYVVFRFLPESSPKGWPLWAGALTTMLGLLGGRFLMTLYLEFGNVSSLYGAAGSAVIFLMLAYWCSLAFLFGARFAWALEQIWKKHQHIDLVVESVESH